MLLRFTKMHGLGNDFVVLDLITQRFTLQEHHIRKLADRHFGIGCDQVLVVEPPKSPDVDFRYRIYNADGGEVEQCGNGARCFAKFVREKKLTGKNPIRVETNTGVIELAINDNRHVQVNMGVPILQAELVPFVSDQADSNSYMIEAAGQPCEIGVVSMGNPHSVMLVDDITTAPVATLGPAIESHPQFPQRVNAGFMQLISRKEVNLRVYERGVGETLACGTGACAAVVSGQMRGLLDQQVMVHLPGGSLTIEWQGIGQPVIMTGPATSVFEGQIQL
jgi:diaminopimelate epimerase